MSKEHVSSLVGRKYNMVSRSGSAISDTECTVASLFAAIYHKNQSLRSEEMHLIPGKSLGGTYRNQQDGYEL